MQDFKSQHDLTKEILMPNPKTQATPGPWRVHDQRRVYSDDGMVADCGIQWADDDDEDGAERDWYRAEANARLIAAAPQMREALEAAYRAMTHPTGEQQEWKDVLENKAIVLVGAALRAANGED